MTEVSVVIASYNRAGHLRRCLAALERQTLAPERFEVVVVDDGSTDATPGLLGAYDGSLRLRAERQANRGAGAARNRGIAVAAAEWVVFLDDDILADPTMLAEHVAAQRDGGGVVGVGMLRLHIAARGGLASYFGAWWAEHYRRLDSGEEEPSFWDCYSGNMSAPARVLRAVGGFDEGLARTEDVELGLRLEREGLRIRYVPGATAEQRHEKGFAEIVRDYDRAGRAALDMWRRHPELIRHAPLGDFAQGGTRAVLGRRLALAMRAPVWPLALADRFLGRRPPRRLYEFLQLYCFWRSFRAALDDRDTWRRFTRGTVILMYHAVGSSGERASRYVIPSGRLRRQLAWIRLRRRPVLSLDEYAGCRERDELPPARSVVLTFDDGYADTAERAAPMLRRAGLTATVFAVSDRMGEVNSWDADGTLAGRPLLDWDALARLADAGFEVGAHTRTHADLTAVDAQCRDEEVEGSRARIAERLDRDVSHFAYPFGRRSEAVERVVARGGFATACGVEPGANGCAVPIHALRRMEVWGTRHFARFALDLWLGRPVGAPREDGDG